MLLYSGLFLVAIITYFILFRFKLLKLFKTKNLEAINRITKETSNFINKHRLLEMFTKNLISMVENNSGVAMWIKDEEDRYIFANKALRLMLFRGKEMHELVGKTDGDIAGKPSNNKKIEAYLRLVKPDEYPNLNSKQFIDNNSICNLTDIITRVLRVPCRFYEEVEGLSLDVYKTPLIDDTGNIIGTVGTLFDITNNKDLKKARLILMESENKAFKINGSNNYYIKEYTFGEFI
jgi:PAS domain-containing protein